MRNPIATADDRETVILFDFQGTPYRLLLPHGRSQYRLDKGEHDPADAGRPWLLRWSRCARGRRAGLAIATTETTDDADLPQALLDAVERALRYAEEGPATGGGLLLH